MKPSRLILYAGSALVFFSVAFSSCKSCSKQPDSTLKEEPTPDVQVNPAFERTPPIAEEVFVQQIKDDPNHVLFMARFSKEVLRLKEPFLALNVGDEKMVLRDDGKSGDEVAGDNIFTKRMDVTAKDLAAELESQNKQALERGVASTFSGRMIVTLPQDRDRSVLKTFNDFRPVKIKGIRRRGAAVLKDHSLMITDLNVVEDTLRTWNPCTQKGNVDGPWTFKTLMKNLASPNPGAMASDADLSTFVRNWLNHWATSQMVNSDNVASRTAINTTIVNNWLSQSQAAGAPVGQLDMRFAPFKLLAIVNRLDLRSNMGYGVSNAGEGRLVFGLVNCSSNASREMTVIFEYGLPMRKCASVKAFAQEWYDLKDLAFTDPLFNQKLEHITDQFTKCGTSPSKPNQSSLNQLRTNEIALASPWELREFVLAVSGQMSEVTVKQEPSRIHNQKINNANCQRLASFVNTNQADILARNYTVPEVISGVAFLGGKAQTEFRPVGAASGINPHHWNGTVAAGLAFINDNNTRQEFSLNTCSGCHGGETQTFFTHVDPVFFGTQATLSGFLTGSPGRGGAGAFPVDLDGPNDTMAVPDPAARASAFNRRKFCDLQRRADDLENLVNTSCIGIFPIRDLMVFEPLRMVH